MENKQFNKPNDYVPGLFAHTFKAFLKMLGKDKNSVEILLAFCAGVLALATFVGNITMLLIFRRKLKFEWPDYFFALIALSGCIYFAIFNYQQSLRSEPDFGSSPSFFAFAIIYLFFAIFLIMAIVRHIKPKQIDLNSTLLKENEPQSPKMMQAVYEPFLVLIIGGVFCIFNRLAGLPLITCSIFLWAHLLFNNVSGHSQLPDNVIPMNTNPTKKTSDNYVK